MTSNFISQAGTMETHGIPNDIMQNIDPLTTIIFVPIVDQLLYPLLRRLNIPFRPISRITVGFLLASLSMAYAAIVQHIIYISPPCYTTPVTPCADPNKVHVAVQTPGYLFIGLSEIFASITGLDYAYTKAPPAMKSFVMSMFLLTSALGSAIGIALSPTAEGPKLVWMYTGLSVATAVAGCVFWVLFRGLNSREEGLNGLEGVRDKEVEME